MKKVIVFVFVALVLINAKFTKYETKQVSTDVWTVKDTYEGKR